MAQPRRARLPVTQSWRIRRNWTRLKPLSVSKACTALLSVATTALGTQIWKRLASPWPAQSALTEVTLSVVPRTVSKRRPWRSRVHHLKLIKSVTRLAITTLYVRVHIWQKRCWERDSGGRTATVSSTWSSNLGSWPACQAQVNTATKRSSITKQSLPSLSGLKNRNHST